MCGAGGGRLAVCTVHRGAAGPGPGAGARLGDRAAGRPGRRGAGRTAAGIRRPPDGADPDLARARLFELLLGLFEALAERRPLVLVVEDVHWADRPTRDLLGFLVRNLRHAGVLLVVTFRSDELDRGHPLRALLAGLGRMDAVIRVELPRLSRGEVEAELEGTWLGRRNRR